jgi:cobalamin biosynthesis Mg chelatase CobN
MNKEDIISDIDRLLNNSGNSENQQVFDDKNQNELMQQQMAQAQQAQMQQQMQQQMAQAQMQQQMAQAQQAQMAQAQQAQMAQAQQAQMAQAHMQQMAQAQQAQGRGQQLPPHVLQQLLQQQMHNHNIPNLQGQKIEQMNNSPSNSMTDSTIDMIKDFIYANRESLVLLLLFCFLLTPQLNSVFNKIPYISNVESTTFGRVNEYPGYSGILLRGIIFVGIFIGLKKLNLI